jgi:AraC family transcriptional regulator
MALSLQPLASGKGWCVSDVVCTAGPRDRPFEERHEQMCIALVTRGTFNYRSTQGAAVLAPGSLLLGNSGACFECGHEHSVGDRCLSFHFSPEFFETVAAAVPGQRHCAFTAPRLPVLPDLLPVIAAAESLRGSPAVVDEFHELTLRLAGAVCRALNVGSRSLRAPNDRDRKRVAAALRRIEADPAQPLSLNELATGVAMSPFHFLRVFEQVVGVTPAQYILRSRLRRAAVELRNSRDSVAAIAADCGFADLSTFNRQFKRLMGATPGTFRVTANGSRPIPQ